MKYSVFANKDKKDYKLFLDDPVSIVRYEKLKYPFLDKLTEKQVSFFWQPGEIDCTKDQKDFKGLSVHEQHIFTSNLKRQILLDSIQGRSPVVSLLPIVSSPELENWVITWSFFETIHSKSYSHIIRNIYSDPSKIFDEIMDIEQIIECSKDISKYYDDLIHSTQNVNLNDDFERYALKVRLWLCLNAINALEGIRFYVSFACSWAFAELKKMEGNAKIIKFIARDENLHLASTQQILRALMNEDPEFKKIRDETMDEVVKMFESVVEQEKKWADYLFKDGSMIGLNGNLLKEYVEWIAQKRMTAIGLPSSYKGGSNPLPWTQKWIAGSDVQVAPQEVELSSYVVGKVKQDINETVLGNLKL